MWHSEVLFGFFFSVWFPKCLLYLFKNIWEHLCYNFIINNFSVFSLKIFCIFSAHDSLSCFFFHWYLIDIECVHLSYELLYVWVLGVLWRSTQSGFLPLSLLPSDFMRSFWFVLLNCSFPSLECLLLPSLLVLVTFLLPWVNTVVQGNTVKF